MTLENWNTILYEVLMTDINPFISCIYLISWIFIGNFVFLNLFLAILLDGFTQDEAQNGEDNESDGLNDD
jgi:hypothetical protein